MLLTTVLFAALQAAPAPPATPLNETAEALDLRSALQDSGPERQDIRANVFTGSSQDNVSIVQLRSRDLVAVWHSRRQEEGTYAVRARRFTPGGDPIGGEVAINQTTAGMQVEPSLSAEPGATAGVWFAWVSRGQDGSGDGVWARRFSPEMDRASDELRVSDRVAGDQSEPTIVAFEDGRALCVWTGPGETVGDELATSRRAVYGRFIGTDGEPSGPRLTLTPDSTSTFRTPSITRCKDGAFLAASASDEAGKPKGILVRHITESGALSPAIYVDGAEGLPVEPSLGATEDRVAVAWLVAPPEGNGEYEIRWRNVRVGDGATEEKLLTEPIRSVKSPFAGYTSGLSVAADGAQTALIWSRYLEGETPRLMATILGEAEDDGEPRVLFEPAPLPKVDGGKQAMSVGGASPRTCFLAGGRLAAAWHGDGELGDKSGAHLTLLDAVGDGASPRIFAEVVIDRSTTKSLPLLEVPAPVVAKADRAGADRGRANGAGTRIAGAQRSSTQAPAPHDPPTFRKEDVNGTPTFPMVRSAGPGGDIDFLGFNSTGWTPPDPEMAVGMNHIVAIVNGGIRFFDKQGTLLFEDQIEGAGGFWGNLGATGFVFDPEVVWDPHTDRFVAIAAERDGSDSYFLLAISDDGDPNGSWFKYRLDVTPLIGANIDSVNLSLDGSAIYLTGDWFNPTRYFIYTIDKASVLNGGTPITTDTTINGQHSMGAPVNYDASSSSGYFLFAPESGSSNSVVLYALNDPLGSPQVQSVTIPVPTYSQPQNPPQMGTSSRPEMFEARFWNAVLRNGRLWATHHQGSPVKQRWYEFDLAGWPQSGQQPTLVQSGDVDGGAGVSTFFGSLWVNDAGTMSLTCAMSSSSSFISMVRTGRSATAPLGDTGDIETVITSTSAETSGRWGDYSATNDDPAEPGRFWGHHEYRTSGWRTRIAGYVPCDGGFSTYCVSSPNSVGAGAVISASGSASVAANSVVLECQQMAPGAFGVFFYGDAQASVSVGDGVLCAGGNLFRVAVTQADFIGRSFLNLDLTMPPVPAAAITSGSTWNFQHFYRDIQPGGSGLNFSNAVEIQFCP